LGSDAERRGVGSHHGGDDAACRQARRHGPVRRHRAPAGARLVRGGRDRRSGGGDVCAALGWHAMKSSLRPLQERFAAEVTGADLRTLQDPAELEGIREGMDRFAVLVFRAQPLGDAEQLAFAERFDGKLHTKTGSAVLGRNRFGNEALTDISNVDESGEVMQTGDRRRMYGLGNRLWHTDASFEDPPGRYSMLHARVLPPVDADTEFADMRAAYDDL